MRTNPATISFWALHGTIGEHEIRWSTTPAQGYEPRLIDPPSPFSIGMGAVVGQIERASTSIRLDNTDGGLDYFFTGSDLMELEFSGPSFLSLECAVYRIEINPDTGATTEYKYSPTMVVSGPVREVPGEISFSLAVNADPILGPSKAQIKVSELMGKHAEVTYAANWFNYHAPSVAADPQILWDRTTREQTTESDTIVPYIYGSTTLQLIDLSDEAERYCLAGFILEEEAADIMGQLYSFCIIRDGRSFAWGDNGAVYIPFIVKVEDKLCLFFYRTVIDAKLGDVDGEVWLVMGTGSSHQRNPMALLREIIREHSERGLPGIHTGRFISTERAARRFTGAVAGLFNDAATVGDLIHAIAPIFSLNAWIGTDDKLHFALEPSASELTRSIPALALIPRITELDDFPNNGLPSWSTVIPTDPDDPAATITRLVIEFPDYLRRVFPLETQQDRATVRRTVPIKNTVELRIGGDWIDPRRATPVFRSLAGRGAFPTRQITLATHVSTAELGVGATVRISSPNAIGPFEDRLAMIRRIEVRPADEATILTLHDLGPALATRSAKLDSMSYWTEADYRVVGWSVAGNQVTLFQPVADSHWVGLQLWIDGGSYRIVSVDSPSRMTLATNPDKPSGVGFKVMHSRTSAHEINNAPFRPEYATAANIATGKHASGEAGYRYGR